MRFVLLVFAVGFVAAVSFSTSAAPLREAGYVSDGLRGAHPFSPIRYDAGHRDAVASVAIGIVALTATESLSDSEPLRL